MWNRMRPLSRGWNNTTTSYFHNEAQSSCNCTAQSCSCNYTEGHCSALQLISAPEFNKLNSTRPSITNSLIYHLHFKGKGNALRFYLADAWFEYWLRHRLSCGFRQSLQPMPGQYLDFTMITSFQILSVSVTVHLKLQSAILKRYKITSRNN